MVVLSEKDLDFSGLVPPPPYFAAEQRNHEMVSPSLTPPSSSSQLCASDLTASTHIGTRLTAPPLPSHVLLLIVYNTFPRPNEMRLDRATGGRASESAAEMAVRTTRTLYWMAFCLRAVNRGFYLAAMHVLRSTFLPHYMRLVRTPYSSDPFPHTSLSSESQNRTSSRLGVGNRQASHVVASAQDESEILDRYILYQLHEDIFVDDSSLHTARPDTLRDLFNFVQPRARLTDLVRAYAASAGLVTFSERGEDVELQADVEDYGNDTAGEMVNVSTESPSSSLTISNRKGSRFKARLARSSSSLTLTSSSNGSHPSSTLRSKEFGYNYRLPYSSSSSSLYAPRVPSSYNSVRSQAKRKIPYTALRISFSPRRVGLMYTAPGSSGSGPRTIVDISRDRGETLERTATRLVQGLRTYIVNGL